jgi:hypothetical protein
VQRFTAPTLALALAILGPASAVAQEIPRATVRLPEGADHAVVPFDLYRRWMMVPVTVEDSPPLRFILDSGAPITVLASLELGQTLPLQIIGQAQIGGAGSGAATEVYVAGDVSMRVGPIDIAGASLAVGLGADALGGADGVIGGPIFENFAVEIDWVDQKLILHDPERWSPAADLSVLPLRPTRTGHLATTVQLSIAGEPPVAVELFLDTGAGHALSLEAGGLPELAAPDHRLENLLIGWGANGPVYGDIARTASLQLGDYRLEHVVTTFPSSAAWSRIGAEQGEPIFGNLGVQVLYRFRTVIDVPNRRLLLTPNEFYDRPFAFDQAGMALLPGDPGAAAITVADVVDDSPAAQAGVRIGDEILSIEGRPVSTIAPEEVQSLFEGPSGRLLRVTFRRGEEVFEAPLELRPLI